MVRIDNDEKSTVIYVVEQGGRRREARIAIQLGDGMTIDEMGPFMAKTIADVWVNGPKKIRTIGYTVQEYADLQRAPAGDQPSNQPSDQPIDQKPGVRKARRCARTVATGATPAPALVSTAPEPRPDRARAAPEPAPGRLEPAQPAPLAPGEVF